MPFNLQLRSIARSVAAGDAVAAQSLVDHLMGKSPSNALSDDALVSRAVALINRSLDGPITLTAVAKAMHRSPSRLAHRFSAATGLPLRRYVLWRRLCAGDARCKLDRSSPHCRVRGLRTSVANFPRNVRRHTIFALQTPPGQGHVFAKPPRTAEQGALTCDECSNLSPGSLGKHGFLHLGYARLQWSKSGRSPRRVSTLIRSGNVLCDS